jgi:hypothetical protein
LTNEAYNVLDLPREMGISLKNEKTLQGDDKPPLGQVLYANITSEPVDKQELLNPLMFTAECDGILNKPQSVKPIAAGLRITWQPSGVENWKIWQNTCTCCGDIREHMCEFTWENNTPPLRQVQSPNCFSILEQLSDTVLEAKLDHRD